jgi:rhodanese-related sulfurtransferase
MNYFYGFIILLVCYQLYNFYRLKKRTGGLTNYTPQEAAAKMKSDSNVILLDVRSDAERQQSSIKGSIHIPLNKIDSAVSELEKYRDKEIICYCASGSRSVAAAIKLKEKGFNASNLRGGIGAWNASGVK